MTLDLDRRLHAARLEIARLVRDLGEVTRERDELAAKVAALSLHIRHDDYCHDMNCLGCGCDPGCTCERVVILADIPARASAILGVVEAARGFVARLTSDNAAQWHDHMRKKLAALDGKDRP